MAHEEIRSGKVFKSPTAPFSLATRTTGGTLVHVSGQVASGADGHTVGQGDIERQTTQVLENIKALVEAAGGTLAYSPPGETAEKGHYCNRSYAPAARAQARKIAMGEQVHPQQVDQVGQRPAPPGAERRPRELRCPGVVASPLQGVYPGATS